MAREKAPKTYEELRAARAKEWETAQAMAAKSLAELHGGLAQMPDVKDAPLPGATWQARGVQCSKCQGDQFYCQRWVTVNGVRHRAELECAACAALETYDFGLKAWLP